MSDDLYALLGVPRDADEATLKSAWRDIARRLHPDRNPGDPDATERFQRISAAWTVLSDPDKRLVYDRLGSGALREGLVADLARGIREDDAARARGRSGQRAPHPPPRPRPAPAPRRGPATPPRDIRMELGLTLREAAAGGPRTVRVVDDGPCDTCGGSGIRGSGRMCGECDRGRVPRVRDVDVVVPISVASGRTLRMPGQGRAGSDGRRGALILDVVVAPDPVLRRLGQNLHVSVPWPVGAKTVVAPVLEGTVTVDVPAKARAGQIIRVLGQGMPGDGPRPAGDLLVTLRPS